MNYNCVSGFVFIGSVVEVVCVVVIDDDNDVFIAGVVAHGVVVCAVNIFVLFLRLVF